MESDRKWYVIHTYSGYENKVKTNLENKVKTMGIEDKIFNVVVPMEKEEEKKDGVKRVVEKKIFPGYVLSTRLISSKKKYDFPGEMVCVVRSSISNSSASKSFRHSSEKSR